MNKENKTLAIYGIQDSVVSTSPFNVHDHTLVLFEGGKIEKFIQLERLSGIKSDNSMPTLIYPILQQWKLTGKKDIDFIFTDNVLGRSFINTSGNIRFEACPANNRLHKAHEVGQLFWLDHIQKAYILNHELAHVYSCTPFYGDFEEGSTMVHFDGGASVSNFSAWQRSKGQDHLLEYDWDLKPITSMWNANALVFHILGAGIKDHLSVPGKLMGLAAYGQYSKKIHQWLSRHDYFQTIWKGKKTFLNAARSDFGYPLSHISDKSALIQDIAATIQEIFCQAIVSRLQQIQGKTKSHTLYYTGGAALNIVANRRIAEQSGFSSIKIPPCTNDTGLALGAGAYLELKKHQTLQYATPYLNNDKLSDEPVNLHTIPQVAALLKDQKIIGICNGYGEIGPRALGNRSLLALAQNRKLAQRVSMEIKGREWYRPLAPVALEDNIKRYTGLDEIPSLSDYMLIEFQVLQPYQKELEGVVHQNGTARFQCIRSETQNPFLFHLLSYLWKTHQIGALINTSFNFRGQPIVHTKEQAFMAAREQKLDALILNGHLKILK